MGVWLREDSKNIQVIRGQKQIENPYTQSN